MPRASASPMPSPPLARSRAGSSWANILKTAPSASGGMPMPLSRTRSSAWPSAQVSSTSIRPPSGVYLAALASRLMTTCARRVASPSTTSGVSPTDRRSVWRAAAMAGAMSWAAPRTSGARSTAVRRSRIRFWVMRETSIRSSTSRVRWRSWRSKACSRRSSAPLPYLSLKTSTALRIGASGLRSSCDRVARNSSLRRSAAVSCRLSACSCRSAARWASSASSATLRAPSSACS